MLVQKQLPEASGHDCLDFETDARKERSQRVRQDVHQFRLYLTALCIFACVLRNKPCILLALGRSTVLVAEANRAANVGEVACTMHLRIEVRLHQASMSQDCKWAGHV